MIINPLVLEFFSLNTSVGVELLIGHCFWCLESGVKEAFVVDGP
jgi:hypothetical protein